MRVLVTGGAGFIGSTLVRLLLAERPGWRVVTLDKLTYAGREENLAEVAGHPGHRFVRGDVCDGPLLARLLAEERVEAVLHLAAESHVDRSIEAPAVFVETNVRGTQVLLEASRAAGVARFVQCSTDEVYGALGPQGTFTEASPLQPTSPYAASKAAGDLLALAAARTWGLPVVVTRCSNNLGPRQHPEKLIPVAIAAALQGRPVPVYGDGQQVRDWIDVEDHARGLLAALERGRPGEVYHLGAGQERRNLDVVRAILAHLGRPATQLAFVADRPGHDRRYALDASRARAELGWSPRHAFEASLRATVDWYRANRGWWEPVLARAGAAGEAPG